MVGIVLVSHSRSIAEGAAALAREMGGDDVLIAPAGGLDDAGATGTDAMRVLAAIEAVWSDDGVLVLMDLGSAVMSAEMAIEFLEEPRRPKVRLCDAPLVEGAVAAAVAAKLGRTLDEVTDEARGGLAGKTAHLGTPAERGPDEEVIPSGASTPSGPEVRLAVTVDLPHGLHARPAARLVQTASAFDADVRVTNASEGRGPVSARSLNAVATLGATEGQRLEIVARGPEANAAVEALRELAERRFDEAPEDLGREVVAQTPAGRVSVAAATEPGTLRGLPASPGVAVGAARRFTSQELEAPGTIEPRGTDHELTALERAVAATATDIARQRDQIAAKAGAARAAIFDAHLLFLSDEALLAPVRDEIRAGASAGDAWQGTVAALAATWGALADPYLRARAADLRSVAKQVLARLLGVEVPRPGLHARGILVADDLEPADTAGLDAELCLGIATAHGGPTSHAAVIARAMAIPAVVGLGEDLAGIEEGTMLGVDGAAGVVYVEPDDARRARLETVGAEHAERAAAARSRAAEPAVTVDGVAIEVAANIGGPADVAGAVAAGCDGVGLFRTEFLFLEREDLPDEREQEAAYRAAAEALGGRPLLVRTLDAGADKPLPSLGQEPEANPFLGVRGLRLGLARPEILDVQLRALVRAAADHPLRIMFPMVATIDELRAAHAALERARASTGVIARPDVGIMIEVPAAALSARHLAAEVDFFSVGTNDLTQYTLAADRGNEHVAPLADPLHPAVLRLIAMAADAAVSRGAWTGVCGEIAGDPDATELLLGLGVRELSMSPPTIPLVKQAVRATDLARARERARAAVELASGQEVRELLSRDVPPSPTPARYASSE